MHADLSQFRLELVQLTVMDQHSMQQVACEVIVA